MTKNILYLLCIILLSNCVQTNPENYITYIEGYWEIEKVITHEGLEKQYNFNQNIDFFEIHELKGFRKKVQPQFDGGFITTKDQENFTLKIENDSLRIYYKTPLMEWKETIISAKENEMIIINEVGNLYFYKPYKKMDL
ncbi:hypothetical protein GCM10022393_00970 [Aquimarina addita]|uniref:Lipocalin-like domain-containing protein n=1 Tax=Aquimarina addita TaxID=870485 RepID=A0ABP7X7E0_9FLAO